MELEEKESQHIDSSFFILHSSFKKHENISIKLRFLFHQVQAV